MIAKTSLFLFDKELYFYFAFSQFYKNDKSKEDFIQLFFLSIIIKKKLSTWVVSYEPEAYQPYSYKLEGYFQDLNI